MFWFSLVAQYCATVTKETWKREVTEAYILETCSQPESAAIILGRSSSGVNTSEGKACCKQLKQKIHV